MVSGLFRSTIWNQTIPDHLRGRLAGIEMVSYTTGPLLGNAEAVAQADTVLGAQLRWDRALVDAGAAGAMLGQLEAVLEAVAANAGVLRRTRHAYTAS